MVYWDDLGFATNYTVDADLEYPGDGRWDFPERRIPNPGSDLVGAPQALIRPVQADPWLLVTGFTNLGALYATADPDIICVCERLSRVTFVDVRDPTVQTTTDDLYPVRVAAALDQGLLLVLEWSGITAIGADGVRWRQPNLVYDIHVTRSDGDRIYYRGGNVDVGGEIRGSLDARTGEVIHLSSARKRSREGIRLPAQPRDVSKPEDLEHQTNQKRARDPGQGLFGR